MMKNVLPLSLSLPGPACDAADVLMFDNFPGPFSAVDGKDPIIGSGTWAVSADPAHAFSGEGKLALTVDGGNAYVQIALGEIPTEIGCTFELVEPFPAVGGGSPVLALYQAFDTFRQNNFHFLAGRNVLGWNYWKDSVGDIPPAWKINNNYALSTNSFFTYRILIDPPYAFGFLFDSAGTLIGNITINEPNMANVIGPHMFVQLFSTKMNYRSVWARRKNASSFPDATFVRGAAIHVGPGTPSGVLSARYDGSFNAPAPRIAAHKGDAEFGVSAESAGNARLVLSTALGPFLITGASIARAGTGYQRNDLLIVQGGTLQPGGSPAQLRVETVGPGGAVTSISVAEPGLYAAFPTPIDQAPGVPVAPGDAEFNLASAGTNTLACRIELAPSLDLTFRHFDNQAWLTKPGNGGFPYVPDGIRIGGNEGPVWLSGAGSPNGVITAPRGSLFSRTDGGAGEVLYVKESDTGSSNWIAK